MYTLREIVIVYSITCLHLKYCNMNTFPYKYVLKQPYYFFKSNVTCVEHY